jgi:hypothetical protein
VTASVKRDWEGRESMKARVHARERKRDRERERERERESTNIYAYSG